MIKHDRTSPHDAAILPNSRIVIASVFHSRDDDTRVSSDYPVCSHRRSVGSRSRSCGEGSIMLIIAHSGTPAGVTFQPRRASIARDVDKPIVRADPEHAALVWRLAKAKMVQ